ncbi:MAG: hypothetical protein JSS79_07860 [Bacteroidetes bacterium]|nr:hypothetical protein [Bacteroidota bacterium]
MKTTTKTKINGASWFLFILLIISLMVSGKACAQRMPVEPQDFYFGVEATNGTRSFQMKSDLSTLQGLHVNQSGQSYGIIFGSRLIMGKIRIGKYSSSGSEASTIKSDALEIGTNFSPMQLFNNKSRIVEPYLSIAFDQAAVKSSGIYTPPPTLASSSSSNSCSCKCPNSPSIPADPDQASSAPTFVNSSPTPYSGKITTARATVGVGLKVHLRRGTSFLNLFSEAKYGMALGTNATTQALLNTSMLSQMSVDVGVSIGLIHNKANKKVYRSRYR